MRQMSVARYIVAVFTTLFLVTKESRAEEKVAVSARFLTVEQVQVLIDHDWPVEGQRPNYPLLMRGWRVTFDNPWLSTIFDHRVLYALEDALIASLHNWDTSVRVLSGRNTEEEAKETAKGVGKSFFRRVLLDPFNDAYMPPHTGITVDLNGDRFMIGFKLKF